MYVQHKSGQGEKWKVISTRGNAWLVQSPDAEPVNWDLPKSDYILCAPPERWQDITARIEVQDGAYCVDPIKAKRWLAMPDGYRLRKVEVWQTALNNNLLTGEGKMTALVMEKLA